MLKKIFTTLISARPKGEIGLRMKRKVLIWGMGSYYQKKKEKIVESNDILAYIDSDKVGEVEDVLIIKPEDISRYEYDYIYLMSPTYMFEMVKKLMLLRVSINKIVLGPNCAPLTFEERRYISDRNYLFLDMKGNMYYKNDGQIIEFNKKEDIQKAIKLSEAKFDREIFKKVPLKPISRVLGCERGESILRKYVNQFIDENKSYIQGAVMEIGDRTYSNKYKDNIGKSYVFDYNNGSDKYNIKGNLETGESVKEEFVDCFIFTQTLCFIYDVKAAAQNVIKMLKKGGTVLLTVTGISSITRGDYENYGLYWRFSDMAIKRLFAEIVEVESVEIKLYGNVKTAAAFLYGISPDELETEEMEYQDRDYQLLIGAIIKKGEK